MAKPVDDDGGEIPEPAEPPPPRPPRPPRPLPPQAPPPPGETPSITSWTRLESSCRDPDMQHGLAARIFDPLWMLTRQWQVGEFQGEDAGSPVMARTRARSARLSRAFLGELAPNSAIQARPYDSRALPLEVLVERRRVRARAAAEARQLRLAIDAGLHFLRLVDGLVVSRPYRDAFIAVYPLLLPDAATLAGLDEDSLGFYLTMAGRSVDARRLAAAFRKADGSVAAPDPALQVAAGDRAEIQQAAGQWLDWYDALFSEPLAGDGDAWVAERLEYALSVAAQMSARPDDQKTLSAAEMVDGHLDWSDFDLNLEVSLGSQHDQAVENIVQAGIPAPVSFKGTPAARFWEFEDARIEYGLMPVGPADLAQLLMIEYTSSYGNDWFLLPLELAIGSLTTIDSLVVTDTFGVRTLLKPLGDPDLGPANWRMFQHAYRQGSDAAPTGAESNLFFLAPALGASLQSAPQEDVLFMRDEMANIAWGIERIIESPLGAPLLRRDEVPPEAAAQPLERAAGEAAAPPPRYRLASPLPPYWIPLLPVQHAASGGGIVLRLKRGAVLEADGTQRVRHALGEVLNAASPLLLHDEEVPREGLRVTRHYQLARWSNGASFAWMALRTQVGRGEGSSGLRFDSLEGDQGGG